jgi:DNA-binding NarL/FixJ family response regulator
MCKDKRIMKVYNELLTISSVSDRISAIDRIDRDKIKICVIDDEGYNTEPLLALNYQKVDKFLDFPNIVQLSDYDVILCDIEGVGKQIDYVNQGLAIADQLKSQYPYKVVLIYTGKSSDTYSQSSLKNDGIIRKQTPNSEIARIIDTKILESRDYKKVFEFTKRELISRGASSKMIAIYEHYYCKSLLSSRDLLTNQPFFKNSNHNPDLNLAVGALQLLVSTIQLYSSMKRT